MSFVHPPFPRLPGTTGAIVSTKENMENDENTRSATAEVEEITTTYKPQYTVPDLDFEDDDAEALLLLLRIAHLQFTKVPHTLSFKELLNVAILCDQYDCTKMVQPWTASWFAKEKTMSLAEGNEQYLRIAWVFGRQKAFETLAQKLVMEVHVQGEQGNRECMSTSGQRLPELMPEGIIGTSIAQAFGTQTHLHILILPREYFETTTSHNHEAVQRVR